MLPVCGTESKAAVFLELVGRSFVVGRLLLRLHLGLLLLALEFVVALRPQVGLVVPVRLRSLVLRLLLLLLLLLHLLQFLQQLLRSLHLLLARLLLLARGCLLIRLLRLLLDLVWDFCFRDELFFLFRGLLRHLRRHRRIRHAICVLATWGSSLRQCLLFPQDEPLWCSRSLLRSQDDVIETRAIEQGGEDVVCWGRPNADYHTLAGY